MRNGNVVSMAVARARREIDSISQWRDEASAILARLREATRDGGATREERAMMRRLAAKIAQVDAMWGPHT
jgi:hypothetical protein